MKEGSHFNQKQHHKNTLPKAKHSIPWGTEAEWVAQVAFAYRNMTRSPLSELANARRRKGGKNLSGKSKPITYGK